MGGGEVCVYGVGELGQGCGAQNSAFLSSAAQWQSHIGDVRDLASREIYSSLYSPARQRHAWSKIQDEKRKVLFLGTSQHQVNNACVSSLLRTPWGGISTPRRQVTVYYYNHPGRKENTPREYPSRWLSTS